MKKKTVENLTPINVNPTLTKEEFESGHGSEELSTKMQHLQTCESAKEMNEKFARFEADFHDGNVNETVLCIKVRTIVCKLKIEIVQKASFNFQNCLDSATAAKVMEAIPSEEESMLGQFTKSVKTLIKYEK